MRRCLLFVVPLASALVAAASANAQQLPGDIAAGRRLAEGVCSDCHRIEKQAGPPRGPGPSFADIARMPSTTPLAISVFLQTSHNNMPNLILNQTEIDDVRSFILSLRNN